MSAPRPVSESVLAPGGWLTTSVLLILGTASGAFLAHSMLEEEVLAAPYLSAPLWQQLVQWLGGTLSIRSQTLLTAVVPSGPIYLSAGVVTLGAWTLGAWLLARRGCGSMPEMLAAWGTRGWRWWLLAAVWSAAWIGSLILGASGATVFLARSSPLWIALIINLWAAEWFALRRLKSHACLLPLDPALAARQGRRAVGLAIVVYTLLFTALNWGLWCNLQIPHGDSAMYEEHLWNITHGKGFRSYLDQGLFLGEHLQVIHLLLIPLHLLWPSQLLLELCDSLIIALTAFPVYSIALRHSGSPRAAAYLAAATLLYFPLQYLDIAIDFKTFRPSAFGIPLLLAGIDQLEQRRWGRMTVLLLLTLSVEEVFAIPVSLLGLWLALTGRADWGALAQGSALADGEDQSGRSWHGVAPAPDAAKGVGRPARRDRLVGAIVCVSAALYLLLAVKVVIPWFRGGATVHFASYFAKFGATPTEILRNMLTQPGLVLGELLDPPTFLCAMYLLAPLGFLPVLSPSRLLVGLPLFGLLCLNELAQDPPGPFHHFHAPLLPILLWAAAAGLGRLAAPSATAPAALDGGTPACSAVRWNTAVCGARFALGCALWSGIAYTLSPLGTRFWDPGRVVAARPTYWRAIYLPDDRARAWARVAPLIPPTAHVAATDFVHARLTHCQRSYDYSRYVRRVAGYEDRVPDDTDYIVIDLQHPYSQSVLGGVHRAADVRELREQPELWELLTPADDPYFVVLKRRPPGTH